MRVGWLFAVLLLTACAGVRLAENPPPGVNLSGHWKLNEADSDDPSRVAMSQSAAQPNTGQSGGTSGGGQGRGRGRGGPAGMAGSSMEPAVPGVGALRDGLHWPGNEVDIKQQGGVVTLSSGGLTQVYRPGRSHQPTGRDAATDPRGDGPPPVCGWDQRTLVVKSDAPSDEDPAFEQRYSLSDDGQRLIEVVDFEGGKSRGFTVSRVWDRVK